MTIPETDGIKKTVTKNTLANDTMEVVVSRGFSGMVFGSKDKFITSAQ